MTMVDFYVISFVLNRWTLAMVHGCFLEWWWSEVNMKLNWIKWKGDGRDGIIFTESICMKNKFSIWRKSISEHSKVSSFFLLVCSQLSFYINIKKYSLLTVLSIQILYVTFVWDKQKFHWTFLFNCTCMVSTM